MIPDPLAHAAPLAPDIDRRLRDSFAAQTLMATLGARLDALAIGLARITAPILPGSLQQNGYGHAGLTFSIADSAAGYAAQTMIPPDADILSVELKINLLAPAQGDRLVAIGRVVKPGRRLVVVQAEVWAEFRAETAATPPRQIALMQGTMIPV